MRKGRIGRIIRVTVALVAVGFPGLFLHSCGNGGGGTTGNGGGDGETFTVIYSENFDGGGFIGDGWTDASGGSVTYTAPSPGADGSTNCARVDGATGTNYEGMYHLWGAGSGVQPSYVSFWLRTPDYASGYNGYVALRMAGDVHSCIFCSLLHLGTSDFNFRINDTTYSGYATDAWHHLEFKSIDWVAQTFDLYIDDSLVEADVGFKNTECTSIERMDVYNFTLSTSCDIDEISMTDQ